MQILQVSKRCYVTDLFIGTIAQRPDYAGSGLVNPQLTSRMQLFSQFHAALT